MEWPDSNKADTPIANAARRIVDLKFAIDTEASSYPNHIPDDLHGPSTSGEYGPHFGSGFLSAILPFLPASGTSNDCITMNVPTAYVLGCSWRIWPDPNISVQDKEEVLNYINSNSGIIDTLYTYIPELMIFMAEEGKNRVNFCRFHNIEHIPARVLVKNYPSADRIKVYVLNTVAGFDVWAVLDGRYVRKVNHYAYALPVFRAYGVEILHSWPLEFPHVNELLKHNDKRLNSYEGNVGIDMEAVRQRLTNDEITHSSNAQLVSCSLLQLGLPLNRILTIAFILLALWLVSLFVLNSVTHELIKTLASILFGFGFGGFLMVITPILKSPKMFLR